MNNLIQQYWGYFIIKPKFDIFMDISGTPPAKTCFGLVCFNSYTKDDLLDEFFRKYPQYKEKK